MEVHWRVAEVNDPHTEVHSVLQTRDTCVKLHLEKRNGANYQLTISLKKQLKTIVVFTDILST